MLSEKAKAALLLRVEIFMTFLQGEEVRTGVHESVLEIADRYSIASQSVRNSIPYPDVQETFESLQSD
jgi:hypothetical protein